MVEGLFFDGVECGGGYAGVGDSDEGSVIVSPCAAGAVFARWNAAVVWTELADNTTLFSPDVEGRLSQAIFLPAEQSVFNSLQAENSQNS